MTGLMAVLFAVVAAARGQTVLAPPIQESWPEWRGPGGIGVAAGDGQLPETWSPRSDNVRWRTEIPGEGISSPIAIDGRVFVTTAYEGSGMRLWRSISRAATVALALFFLLRAAKSIRRGVGPGKTVVGLSLFFAIAAVAMAVDPEMLLSVGEPARNWRVAGATALLGLATAVGWFARDSRWRLIGISAVALCFLLLQIWMPHGALGPPTLKGRLTHFVLPLALVVWYLVAYWRSRRGADTPGTAGAPLAGAAAALPLVLMAVLTFVPANFLTGLQRAVVALDLESGEILWQRAVLKGPAEQKWPHSSYATPTPASDGRQVFAYFGLGLVSLDFDGKVLWRRRFPSYSQHSRYGAGSSPVLTDDAVLVVHEMEDSQGGPPSWIAAFDKRTGEELWKITPREAHDSYTTPLLLKRASETQVLTASWKELVAYDALSGERLWSFGYPMEQMVASIARSGDLLALTGGTHGERALIVLRVSVEGPGTRIDELWRTTRGVGTIVSPVFYDGKLFGLTTPGIMTAYDALSGETLWKKRLEGEYFSSLVAGDGKIYASSSDGATAVIAAADDFELRAQNDLGELVFSSPAVAGCVLIRTTTSLYCIDAESA